MKKALIHQTPAERLANNSASTISAIQQNTTEVIKALKANTPDNSVLIEKLQENKQKLDEVKSASLITNQQGKKSNDLLQKIVDRKENAIVSLDTGDAEIITISGDKGEEGEKGESGKTGEPGERGTDGNDGTDGTDGQDGLDGKDGFNGIDGKDGENGSPDDPDTIIDKVNAATKHIEPKQVKGLLGVIQSVRNYGSNPSGVAVGGGKNIRHLGDGIEISAHVTEINYSTNLTPTYDGNGRITLTAGGGGSYTDEQAQDAVGAMIDGSLTYVDATPLLQRAALTGNVTAPAGSNVTTIAADVVANTMLTNMNNNTIKGRPFGSGTGDPQDLSTTQATALFDVATTSLKGLMSSADKTKLDTLDTGNMYRDPHMKEETYLVAGTGWTYTTDASIIAAMVTAKAISTVSGDGTLGQAATSSTQSSAQGMPVQPGKEYFLSITAGHSALFSGQMYMRMLYYTSTGSLCAGIPGNVFGTDYRTTPAVSLGSDSFLETSSTAPTDASTMRFQTSVRWPTSVNNSAGNGYITTIKIHPRVTSTMLATGVGTGDVVGPASSTDNALTRFDSTTGKLIQNSTVIVGDTGNITGLGTLNTHTVPGGTGTIALTSNITGTNSGTNTGDQTSIVGITGTKAQFNTAVTDGDIAYLNSVNAFSVGGQTITVANTTNVKGLVIYQNDTTNEPLGLQVGPDSSRATADTLVQFNAETGAFSDWSFNTAGNGLPTINLQSTGGTLAAPTASSAANSAKSKISTYAYNSTPAQKEISQITTRLADATAASEDAKFVLSIVTAGTLLDELELTGAALYPAVSDGLALGDTTHQYSDLFLAEGGVINWDNGDATITQTGNSVELAGANLISRIAKRAPTVTQSATPTINTDVTDVAHITGLAQAITSMTTNLTGTPIEGDTLRIDITDNGTARAITWGASFEASTVALPTITVISTRLDVGFVWNIVTSKWRIVATA